MFKKLSALIGMMMILAALCAGQVLAAPSTAPTAVVAVNELSGTLDTVTVGSGLTVGDIVKVYSTATGGVPIGVTVAAGASEVIYIGQLGVAGGTAYVSVTSSGADESTRTPVTFNAETQTAAPVPGSIVNKVAGNPDIISVSGISSGDIVRVYSSAAGQTLMGATVSVGTTASVYVNQLGLAAGNAYVSAQSAGKLESARITMSYLSETSTVPAGVTFANNLSPTTDIVTVPGVVATDVITIYQASTGTATLPIINQTFTAGTAPAPSTMTIEVNQLGVTAGKIYVTITSSGKAESKRTAFTYPAEPVTPKPAGMIITVTNNYTGTDTVDLSGLVAGTTVKLYATSSSTPSVASAIASASGEASISLSLTDALPPVAGTIYMTLTLPTGANESARIAVSYSKPKAAASLLVGTITVFNDYNANVDTLAITGLTALDVIKVYNSTAVSAAAVDTFSAVGGSDSFNLGSNTLNTAGGSIYVTLTTSTMGESVKTRVPYAREYASAMPDMANITVTNNCKPTADTVTVTGLTSGDVISIYTTATGTTSIVTATAAGTTASASLELLTGGGTVYVTLTTSTAGESDRLAVPYAKEAASGQPGKGNITVTNNFGVADKIVVTGVTSGDTIKVYDSATASAKLLGSDVESSGTATITIPDGVDGLKRTGGTIYVAASTPGSNESARTVVTYGSDKSTQPTAKTVLVVNNYVGTADTVAVSGVAVGDIVTIYKTAIGTDTWNTPAALVSSDITNGTATFSIPQLGSVAGKIYVTLTQVDKAMSMRATIAYTSEKLTPAPVAANISVANNRDIEDTVTVSKLTAGQIVSVYTTAIASEAVASVTVPGTPGDTDITVTLTVDDGLLTATGGRVFVTLKNDTSLASARTACTYLSDVTVAPKTSSILVINYTGLTKDTVTVVGLTVGDTVTIYSTALGSTVMAAEKVTGSGTTLMLDTYLLVTKGTIYVTITNEGKAESKRVAVAYTAE